MLLLKNNISTTKHSVGFTWNPANSSPVLTGTGASELVDLGIYFSTIKAVLLADDGTENATIATWANPTIDTGADLSGASGQCMVKIPKFWYKDYFDENGVFTGMDISATAKEGYTLHEKFSYGSGRDYIYIGMYEAGNDGGTKLKSASGIAPLVSQTLTTFRSRAFARGSKWYPFDFYTWDIIKRLVYVYYRTWYVYNALPGYADASAYSDAYKRNTGRTNSLTTPCGSAIVDLAGVDSDLTGVLAAGKAIANRFFWIENIFEHIWKFIDGFAADGRTTANNQAYVTADPALFSSVDADILANYTDLGIVLPESSNEASIISFQKNMLPKAFGGTTSTYISTYFLGYLGDASKNYLRVGLVGGRLNLGSLCGPATLHVYLGPGSAVSYLGGRLCATP